MCSEGAETFDAGQTVGDVNLFRATMDWKGAVAGYLVADQQCGLGARARLDATLAGSFLGFPMRGTLTGGLDLRACFDKHCYYPADICNPARSRSPSRWPTS
jgi:hypothetical protein